MVAPRAIRPIAAPRRGVQFAAAYAAAMGCFTLHNIGRHRDRAAATRLPVVSINARSAGASAFVLAESARCAAGGQESAA